MEIKEILNKIDWLYTSWKVLFLYFVCYNTYFGWNKEPLSDLEVVFDEVFKFSLSFTIGYAIYIAIDYIKYRLKEEINN